MTTATKTKEKPTVKLSGWWALSPEEQAEVLAELPWREEWTFKVYRVSDAAWALDLPEANTYQELLVCGTNVALDDHYADIHGEDAEIGDEMMLTCSTRPFNDNTTVLHKLRPDPTWEGSAFYQEAIFGHEIWLCPFLAVLWGKAPKEIYLKLKPIA